MSSLRQIPYSQRKPNPQPTNNTLKLSPSLPCPLVVCVVELEDVVLVPVEVDVVEVEDVEVDGVDVEDVDDAEADGGSVDTSTETVWVSVSIEAGSVDLIVVDSVGVVFVGVGVRIGVGDASRVDSGSTVVVAATGTDTSVRVGYEIPKLSDMQRVDW